MYLKLICIALLGAMLLIPNAATGKERVDVAICLASDTSTSISDAELLVQRVGYAKALKEPEVLDAIKSNPIGKIGVAYVEWASSDEQLLLIDWMVIDGAASAQEFEEQMNAFLYQRPFADERGLTSISHAIDFCLNLFEASPYAATQLVVDISSDGTNNSAGGSVDVRRARDDALRMGATVNVLAILPVTALEKANKHTNPDGGLEHYFEENVIGGIGAFVEAAAGHGAFADALMRKMRREIIASR